MASVPNSQRVTYEEWLRMPEVSEGIEEVVDGEIRIMPAPKWNHSEIVDHLAWQIKLQVDVHDIIVKVSTFGLIIRKSPLTSRVPDLAVFERRLIVERDGYIHTPPQLIVQVLSPANTRVERQEKLADYASLGVPEVWVFSPEARTVEVLVLENGQFRRSAVLAGGILKPACFPHFQIDIAQIWPD
jgi:Uma2 family endonuclease